MKRQLGFPVPAHAICWNELVFGRLRNTLRSRQRSDSCRLLKPPVDEEDLIRSRSPAPSRAEDNAFVIPMIQFACRKDNSVLLVSTKTA
jgi:hypothetical protein